MLGIIARGAIGSGAPPYLHDDRLLTLEDTAEFFNLVLGVKLSEQEKKDLVAFVLVLQAAAGEPGRQAAAL